MNILTYLKRKKLIDNLTISRPKYITEMLYSTKRPVTVFDQKVQEEPYTKGKTDASSTQTS